MIDDTYTKQVTLSKSEFTDGQLEQYRTESADGRLYETLRPNMVSSHDRLEVDVDALAKADTSRRVLDDVDDLDGVELPELDLPGFGDPGPHCGEPMLRFCSDCGRPHEVGATCGKSSCPRCAPSWARQRATVLGSKLNAARRVFDVRHRERVKYHHAVASTPPDYLVDADNKEEALARAFDFVKRLAKDMGFDMGAIFLHPYRLEKEGNDPEMVDEHDMGRWKHFLFNGWDSDENEPLGIHMDDVLDDLDFWPHFHIIGVGPFIAGGAVTRELHERTGWVFKRIHARNSNVSIFGDHELARALTYTISHTGLKRRADGALEYQKREFGDGWDWIKADEETQQHMDQVTRSVAPDTLGLPYSSLICETDLEEIGADDVPDPSLSGAGRPSAAGHSDSHDTITGGTPVSGSRNHLNEQFNATGLPNKPPEQGGDLREFDSSGWDAPSGGGGHSGAIQAPPVPSLPEPRLEALRSMSPDQLVSLVDGVTDRNVYAFIEALEEAEPRTNVCEGSIISGHKAPRYLDDQEWRRSAPFADALIDKISDLLEAWNGEPPGYFAEQLVEQLEQRRRDPNCEWITRVGWPD